MSQLDIKLSALWPTILMQTTFVGDLETMKKEIYRLTALPSKAEKSSYGGWHSDVHLHEMPAFKPLCEYVSLVCAQVFKVRGAKLHQMWACINKRNDQNLIHTHTNNFNLSGVYYLSVPENSGEIVFRDPRPGANQAPYRLFKDDGDSEALMPFAGLVVLFPSYLEHFVLSNRSNEDRVAVSFNLTLKR